MLNLLWKLAKNRKGAALVEYSLIVAGVALIGAGSVSVLGHKTNDLVATTAAVVPGAHLDDNAPIASGKIIETAANASGAIAIDGATIAGIAAGSTNRIGTNTGLEDGTVNSALVVEQP